MTAMKMETGTGLLETGEGRSFPLGATVFPEGGNFSVFSRDCTGVELLLWQSVDDGRASRTFTLEAASNRSYHYWHLFVPGIAGGSVVRFPRLKS